MHDIDDFDFNIFIKGKGNKMCIEDIKDEVLDACSKEELKDIISLGFDGFDLNELLLDMFNIKNDTNLAMVPNSYHVLDLTN